MAEVVLDQGQLAKKLEALKAQGKKVVFANGCFDMLHVGHVRYLRGAKALGDVLVL
ncbi:MAG TPA: adenylyltransferase/cytidyltransferase family protein, partial [bacterium]